MSKEQETLKPLSAQFKFKQVFGTNQACDIQDQDIISCLKYDPTGKFLCLGDHAGRIIIFSQKSDYENTSTPDESQYNQCYDYYAEFQSHVRQIDPLNGEESAQKITDISWLRPQGKYLKMLTTNCKLIKCWRAFQKTDKKVVKSANKDLSLPKVQHDQPAFVAQQHHVFPSFHRTPINSISPSNNEQYLLSTDQQQSFIWDLQKPSKPYVANSIIGRRKTSTNELAITCSKMHPRSDSLFLYGMNRCELGLCDIRSSGSNGKVVDFGVENKSMKNFFTDMVATVGSAQFMQNSKYIVSRQYLSIKIWDITNTRKPVHSICVQDSLKSKLVNLFETDHIHDRFQVSCSSDSSTIVTGNYNSNFHILNCADGSNSQYQLNFKKQTLVKQMISGKCPPLSKLQTKKRSSVLSFHPLRKQVAVALMNCFFVYSI